MLSIYLLTLLIAVPLFPIQITPNLYTRMTVITLIWTGWLGLNSLFFEPIGYGQAFFSGNFYSSTITISCQIFMCFLGAIIINGWSHKIEKNQKFNTVLGPIENNKIINILVIFSLLGAMFLISSANFISIFVSLELQSLAIYVITGLYKGSYSATGSALKYFFLGAFSTALILLGIGMIYSSSGTFNFEAIQILNSVHGTESNYYYELYIGLFLITIGLFFKMAAAPFHNWAADVYNGTPTMVTLWISTMPKISIIFFLINLFWTTHFGLWNSIFIISSISSIVFGSFLGHSQNKIKRLIAYSTISHIGFILLGIAGASNFESVIFYIFSYSITNATAFLVLLAIGYIKNSKFAIDIDLINDLKGSFWTIPVLALSFAFCLFSIAGVPPIIGFVAKAQILKSALSSPYSIIAIFGIISSVISAVYYLKIIRILFFHKIRANTSLKQSKNYQISNIHSFLISLAIIGVILFIINPKFFINFNVLISSIYF